MKQYALTAPGVETASMEFDIESLSPNLQNASRGSGKEQRPSYRREVRSSGKSARKGPKVLSEREAPVEDLIGELNERKAWLDRRRER